MNSKIFSPRFLFITIAILIAAISRLLPHPFNFTPIGAMALFGGACLTPSLKGARKIIAFVIPLLAMFLSDFIFQISFGYGFHNTIIYVYASFVLITCIGILINRNVRPGTIILASLISSLLFFFITNGGVWAASGMQSGFNGLISTLLAGIPFYNHEVFGSFFFNTIAGDLFWNLVLFGSFYFAQAKFPQLAK